MSESHQRMVTALVCTALFFTGLALPVLVTAKEKAAEAYKVSFEGIGDKEIQGVMESISKTVALKDKPPPSTYLLRGRVLEDVKQFKKALRSLGYYDGEVHFRIDDTVAPSTVLFQIKLHARYRIESVKVKWVDASETLKKHMVSSDNWGLKIGSPLISQSVLDAESKLLGDIKNQGYPFVKMSDRAVVIDYNTKLASVTFVVSPGPLAYLDGTTIKGLKTVDEGVVAKKLPWKPGERYDPARLEKGRQALAKLGLFSSITVKHADSLDRDGRLPITVTVVESKHRTIRAGINYSTDEGPGVTASWENRNLFHGGEKLVVEGSANELIRELKSSFRRPGFFFDKNSLLFGFRLADETTDAYDSRNIETQMQVERELAPKMTLAGGLGFRYSKVDQQSEGDNYALLYTPFTFHWDRTENLLDPIKNGRLEVQAAPYFDMYGQNTYFLKTFLNYSHYFKIIDKPFVLFAARAAVGSITGDSLYGIPADLRFYAGGGGSIRGYSYQSVGPLDENNDPIGGRSVFEVNTELRLRFTETIGGVVFLDGGSAFTSSYPSFDNTLRWGAGVGFRYYTAVGPVRVDVAFPLNRRPGIDDAFQLYMSIGQAF